MFTYSVAQFRTGFLEFKDTNVFPDSAVNYWITLAGKLLSECVWGDLLELGTAMFVAHNLVIEAFNTEAVANGDLPGLNRGIITSETAGKVSISYDAGLVAVEGGGAFNFTSYGIRFYGLLSIVGARPIQVGAGGGYGGGGWFGPGAVYIGGPGSGIY